MWEVGRNSVFIHFFLYLVEVIGWKASVQSGMMSKVDALSPRDAVDLE